MQLKEFITLSGSLRFEHLRPLIVQKYQRTSISSQLLCIVVTCSNG